MPDFGGWGIIPGIEVLREDVPNEVTFGRFEDQVFFGGTIDGAALDAGNTPTTLLRPGLLLGKNSTTNKMKEWDHTATDGTEDIFGVLVTDVDTQRFSSDKDRFLGHVLGSGNVKTRKLIVPGTTALGIAGNALEHLIRGQMFSRFLFDVQPHGNGFGSWRNVVAKTANYTVTEADNGTLFTNRGAAGTVLFTLPTTAEKGLRYGFYAVADFDLTVAGGSVDTMVAFNDATVDSVALSTASEIIGGSFVIVGDGTGWLVMPHLGQDTQTITIAT